MNTCPCGSNKGYNECCEPYITGNKVIDTCEILMRARVTAHINKDIDFLFKTNDKSIRRKNDRSVIKKNVDNIIWSEIDIISVNEDKKEVVWKGVYKDSKGRNQICMERHHFVAQDNDELFFISSERVRSVIPATSEKYPRNSPCYCGSGKKFKKCCVNK